MRSVEGADKFVDDFFCVFEDFSDVFGVGGFGGGDLLFGGLFPLLFEDYFEDGFGVFDVGDDLVVEEVLEGFV